MKARTGRCLLRGALAFAACLAALSWQAVAADPPIDGEKLVFLNWADYLDPEAATAFEDENQARIAQVYFESDLARNSLVALNDARDFDVAIVDSGALALYRRNGWLAPIRASQVPNLRHIGFRWHKSNPAAEGYAVPYFWGTMGIAYRRDRLASPPEEWIDLFRPSPALCGKIMMPTDVRELVGLALRALGHPQRGASPAQLEDARRLLIEQRPCVADYGYVNLDENSELIAGDVLAAVTYNGDALTLRGLDETISYRIPASGSPLWIDYLVVFASSHRKELAYRFIDFLNRPEIAAQQARHLHYASPNEAAVALLDDGYRQNPLIFPPQDVIEVTDSHRPLSARELRSFNRIYASVVHGAGETQ